MQTEDKPITVGHWPLEEIIAALSRPLPKNMLATRKQGGTTLEYIPWHVANRILDKYTPGWRWEVRNITTTAERLFLTGRLTVPTRGGDVWRESTGQELLACGSYGDPSSNAESMAFRRCAAKFGLGLYLYEKK
jgi:hypothetical protein